MYRAAGGSRADKPVLWFHARADWPDFPPCQKECPDLGGPGMRANRPTTTGGAALTSISTMGQAAPIEKQLGLRLEPRKNPATVLVVDYVEEKPAEN